MTTLIAGFQPFPGAPYNPSADLIRALQGMGDDAQIATVVLPVGWDESWPRLRAAIRESGAAHVVLFGLHMTAERLRLELVARNRRELGREDAFSNFPAGPSILEGPPLYPSRMPWADVAHLLRERRIDFEWSTNAGGYLCNDTLYRLAHHAGDHGVSSFGFVHLPMSDQRIGDWIGGTTDLPAVFNTIALPDVVSFARALANLLSSRDRA